MEADFGYLAYSVEKGRRLRRRGLISRAEVMMGHRQVEQAALFYEFSPVRHIPADHLLRPIDRLAAARTWSL
ncbi:hypothetical protein AOQ71_06650 [Bradyrhizobium manausense]|uniref:Uncharacterized protein n=1 Tax=Bradyrhizobium manausense TaxID=989370 RepID=A0A0R3E709_9BRAD|nr:hypothetical protein AOQ71_06650 [Bradyrhizobium manausense]